jgi:hypothetical protein
MLHRLCTRTEYLRLCSRNCMHFLATYTLLALLERHAHELEQPAAFFVSLG